MGINDNISKMIQADMIRAALAAGTRQESALADPFGCIVALATRQFETHSAR